jgi:hypothetical protein
MTRLGDSFQIGPTSFGPAIDLAPRTIPSGHQSNPSKGMTGGLVPPWRYPYPRVTGPIRLLQEMNVLWD